MAFDLQRHVDEFWFTGHWDLMEAACRSHLEREPGDVEAAFALAESCHGLGRHEEARALLQRLADEGGEARFPARLSWLLQEAGDLDGGIAAFRQALAIDPATPLALPHLDPLLEVRDRIDDALARQYSNPAPPGGVMLIHPAGAGFWSDVHQVLGYALAAEIDGRRPWVHWGELSVFADDPAGNAWLDFFEPIGPVDAGEIAAAATGGVYPPAWNGDSVFRNVAGRRKTSGVVSAVDLVARAEPLVVGTHFTGVHLVRHLLPVGHPFAQSDTGTILRRLAPALLRPRPALQERAAAFVRTQFGDEPFIAAHLRGTDKRREQGEHLDAVNLAVGKVVEKLLAERSGCRLLLLTDDRDIATAYRERYGDRVALTDSLRTQGHQSVHLGSGLPARQVGQDVVVDVLTALEADAFVGNRFSNVACIVRALKHWPAGRLHMLGTDDAVFNYAASVFQRR